MAREHSSPFPLTHKSNEAGEWGVGISVEKNHVRLGLEHYLLSMMPRPDILNVRR